ncbi:MAG TPA: 1-deoxy-D-xylulose-5-phosphate reductoisomerase [Clostridia bacterium]|nr:1-deoxy-D-xylulose-5-phosphate reductoisomerase [Clostridia bacterium]
MAKGIAILGSTGSIGRQTLEVCSAFPEEFKVVALAAKGNIDLLEQQIREFSPKIVVVTNHEQGRLLQARVAGMPVRVYLGDENLVEAVVDPEVTTVVTAVSGAVGLLPTMEAIKNGKEIALANKETLVAAGEIVMEAVKHFGSRLLPVDSEHSALFQCLAGNRPGDVEKLILTASGGPFRGWSRDRLARVTPEQALKHPKWNMGAKITIDSATLMNKGLEVIEAKHLFAMDYDRIEVVIHPQSIIHSMVEFRDGVIMAQLGTPDMRVPIQLALTWPERWEGRAGTRLDLLQLKELTFEAPDWQAFPALKLAYEAGKTGGTMPTVLNAANEEAVHAFLRGEIGFPAITDIVQRVMDRHQPVQNPDLETVLAVDREARRQALAVMTGYVI